jgi:hypothetical protein
MKQSCQGICSGPATADIGVVLKVSRVEVIQTLPSEMAVHKQIYGLPTYRQLVELRSDGGKRPARDARR